MVCFRSPYTIQNIASALKVVYISISDNQSIKRVKALGIEKINLQYGEGFRQPVSELSSCPGWH
jgi:hypothetical protein